MREKVFKLIFRLSCFLAPSCLSVYKEYENYSKDIKEKIEKLKCAERQAHLDKHCRPRTETYEHLSSKGQRDQYTKDMPCRVAEGPRWHYSDYDEAKAYHEEE